MLLSSGYRSMNSGVAVCRQNPIIRCTRSAITIGAPPGGYPWKKGARQRAVRSAGSAAIDQPSMRRPAAGTPDGRAKWSALFACGLTMPALAPCRADRALAKTPLLCRFWYSHHQPLLCLAISKMNQRGGRILREVR